MILVRAALISVEEAARISSESVPNDGGDIKASRWTTPSRTLSTSAYDLHGVWLQVHV